MCRVALLLAFLTLAGAAAAAPIGELGYQGVLRDSADKPINATYNVVFRLYDAEIGGNEIIVDQHLIANGQGITFQNGMFATQIGGGQLADGSGPGLYISLGQVFRTFDNIWMTVQVNGQDLSPRVAILSAGHALSAESADSADYAQDAGALGGLPASSFVDTSASSQTKSGSLTVNANLTVGNSAGDVMTVHAAPHLHDDGLYLNYGGPDRSSYLFFYNNGAAGGEYIGWSEAADSFYVSDHISLGAPLSVGNITSSPYNSLGAGQPGAALASHQDLYVGGSVEVDQSVYLDGRLYMDNSGAEETQAIYFYNNASISGEYFRWTDTYDTFSLSDSLAISDTIATGAFSTASTFNRFGSCGPESTLVTSSSDLCVGQELEVEGIAFLNGDLYMDNGLEGEQNIRWLNGGSPNGERLQWDDTADRFEVSDDFHTFGTLSATTKNFVQNHPYRDDLEVVYTSLEGDEATTFTRGFGRLEGGEARVRLGETFAYVTNPELGLSVHLTPRGEWADLYVAELTTEELVVRAAPGAPDVEFDYLVLGLRIGLEDFPVLRPRKAEAYLPPDGWYAGEIAGDEALGGATALARHRAMQARTGRLPAAPAGSAVALREAIGQRPPGFDYPLGSALSVVELEAAATATATAAGDDGAAASDPASAGPESPAVEEARTDEAASGAVASGPAVAPSAGSPDAAARSLAARSFRPEAGGLATLLRPDELVEAGDVLAIDPLTGEPMLARAADDPGVLGVAAGEAGVVLSSGELTGDAADAVAVPVVHAGIVLCKVDAGWGSIRPGDPLTTSPTPGHAMHTDAPKPGAILGKALEPLDTGTGLIRVLVTLR